MKGVILRRMRDEGAQRAVCEGMRNGGAIHREDVEG